MFYFLINVCTFKIVMMMCDNVLRGTYLVNMLIISVKSFFSLTLSDSIQTSKNNERSYSSQCSGGILFKSLGRGVPLGN